MSNLKIFDSYDFLNENEKSMVNEIILEALSRNKINIDNIDYEIKTTLTD